MLAALKNKIIHPKPEAGHRLRKERKFVQGLLDMAKVRTENDAAFGNIRKEYVKTVAEKDCQIAELQK